MSGIEFKGDPSQMGGPIGEAIRDVQKRSSKGYTPEQEAAMAMNHIKMKSGGKVSSASSRADGIAAKGKTRGRMV
jgi:hypothetical protein